MTWVKLDDGLPDHSKVAELSDSAFRTYIEALCFCSRNLTDGELTEAQLRKVVRRKGDAQELLGCRLFDERKGGGAVIHDFLSYQPSRAKVQARRAAVTERVTRHREKNGNTVTDSEPDRACNGVTDATETRDSNAEVTPPRDRDPPPDLESDPVQSSPDPSEKSGSPRARASGGKAKKSHAKPEVPFPDDFDSACKPAVLEWGTTKKYWPVWWIENRLEAFRDLAAAKGWRYADWTAAARNFLRGEAENYGRGPETMPHLARAAGNDIDRRRAEKAAAEAELARRTRAELDAAGGDVDPEQAQRTLADVIAGAQGRRGGST